MLNSIKNIIFRIRLSMVGQYKAADLYRKRYGIKIGKKTRITGKVNWGTEPYLIEIGDNVSITQDIKFITHGGVSKFRDEFPGINYFARIKIGNNVIIGSGSIILPGVIIGDNTIIGAGSVVAKSIPANMVAAGNPAKVLSTLDEYKNKKLKECIFIFEKDPKKRKEEILKKLDEKERELAQINTNENRE